MSELSLRSNPQRVKRERAFNDLLFIQDYSQQNSSKYLCSQLWRYSYIPSPVKRQQRERLKNYRGHTLVAQARAINPLSLIFVLNRYIYSNYWNWLTSMKKFFIPFGSRQTHSLSLMDLKVFRLSTSLMRTSFFIQQLRSEISWSVVGFPLSKS